MKNGVTFVLSRPDGAILMQLRDEKAKRYPNAWNIPGGGCEKDEGPLAAVIREVWEEFELRLESSSCKLFLVQPHPAIPDMMEYVFFCEIGADQQPILHEGADMKWMTVEEIERIPLGFGDETIIPHLKDFLKKKL